MKTPVLLAGLTTFICIFYINCSKPKDNLPLVATSSFTVNNTWECTINGIHYSGSIDTSFLDLIDPLFSDTIVSCTGTSADKRANIYFRIRINRKATRSSTVGTNGGAAFFAFDTVSSHLYKASSNTGVQIAYLIDTLEGGKLKAFFSGTIRDDNVYGAEILHVANGKFNCEIGKGNKEPKFYSYKNENTFNYGYIKSASLITNTLVLDCFPFYDGDAQKFKLIIRTGGTIKPGTYKSEDGDAGLQFYSPSIYPLYITNDAGSLSVTILSVAGDIVKGSFAGTNKDGKQVTNGTFTCRVKNYQAQQDLSDKWKFSFDEYSFYKYTLYGGNVLSVIRSQVNNRHFLTVNGESDNGNSKFKIILSSSSAITPGVYKTGYSLSNQVDSIYFTSNQKLWNGNTTYLFAHENSDTYCRIDTINSQKVTGEFFGNISIRFNTGSHTVTDIRKGSFSGTF